MADTSRASRVRLLVAVALSAALAPLNSTMVAVALPAMGTALGEDSSTLRRALVTSYLITGIVLQSPGGKLGDRLGHRRALALGQVIFAAGAAIAASLHVLPAVATARVIMAGAGAVVVPAATALLRTELPAEVRGRAFGAFGAVMALSAAMGPKLGAVLVARFGWPSIFLANVPVLVVAALLGHAGAARSGPPRDGEARRAPFDLVGALLLGGSLTAVAVGADREAPLALTVAGALGFIPFALWERRAVDPIVDFALFARPAFTGGLLIVALHNLAMYSLLFELPQLATRLFHAGPREVGDALFAMMATMVVVAPLAGRASERLGARAMSLAGSLAALVGVALFAVRPLHSLDDFVLPLVLFGFGLGLSAAPAQASAMSAVPRDRSGMAAGLMSTLRYLGGIAGLAALGYLLTDDADPHAAIVEHGRMTIVYCGALLLAALCAWALPAGPVRAERG